MSKVIIYHQKSPSLLIRLISKLKYYINFSSELVFLIVICNNIFTIKNNKNLLSHSPSRIMPFLSPAYLSSAVCVEQYNIALCCNRSTRRNLLAPFYIETIENMPTYMSLVQYIDCM